MYNKCCETGRMPGSSYQRPISLLCSSRDLEQCSDWTAARAPCSWLADYLVTYCHVMVTGAAQWADSEIGSVPDSVPDTVGRGMCVWNLPVWIDIIKPRACKVFNRCISISHGDAWKSESVTLQKWVCVFYSSIVVVILYSSTYYYY